MQPFWEWLGDIVPATWGVEGFIRINNNGSPLALQERPYHWLWGLTFAYFITSYLITRYKNREVPAVSDRLAIKTKREN